MEVKRKESKPGVRECSDNSRKCSLNFSRLLRVVNADVITTRKPGSDFDWLIV